MRGTVAGGDAGRSIGGHDRHAGERTGRHTRHGAPAVRRGKLYAWRTARSCVDFVLLWDVFSGHIPCPLYKWLVPATAGGSLVHGWAKNKVIIVEEQRGSSASEDRAEEAAIKRTVGTVFTIRERASFNALWILLAIVHGHPLQAASVLDETGVPLEKWQGLVEQMRQCRYGVIVLTTYEPEVERRGGSIGL